MASSPTAADAEVTDLARTLVAIPSHEDERAAGDAVAAWLRDHTAATVSHTEAGVIARKRPGSGSGTEDEGEDAAGEVAVPAADPSRRVALIGHHDVVPPDDAQVTDDEYAVTVREGRLYGRGSADMKGALAAAMVAFRDATAAATFASFAGEERGGVGCRAAIDAGFAPERAVVCEGSTEYTESGVIDVAVAHKGRRGSTLIATGRAAHASEPAAGDNAVYRAADAVRAIRELTPPSATVLGERLTGSLAVTGIEGGAAWNVIPERCTVTVDERTVPGARAPLGDLAAGGDDRAIIDGAAGASSNGDGDGDGGRDGDGDGNGERESAADTESQAGERRQPGVVHRVDQDLPPMACSDPAFADAVLAALHRVQDGAGSQVVKPHATDAGWLADAGTACVVCGAAEPGEAHTADESVSLAVLARCRDVYRGVIERFDAGDSDNHE